MASGWSHKDVMSAQDHAFEDDKVAIVSLARALASKMSRRTGVDADDLNQVALIAIWKAGLQRPARAGVQWFAKTVNWRMLDYARDYTGHRSVLTRNNPTVELVNHYHDYAVTKDETAEVDAKLTLERASAKVEGSLEDQLRLIDGWRLREVAVDAGVSESRMSQRRREYFAAMRRANPGMIRTG